MSFSLFWDIIALISCVLSTPKQLLWYNAADNYQGWGFTGAVLITHNDCPSSFAATTCFEFSSLRDDTQTVFRPTVSTNRSTGYAQITIQFAAKSYTDTNHCFVQYQMQSPSNNANDNEWKTVWSVNGQTDGQKDGIFGRDLGTDADNTGDVIWLRFGMDPSSNNKCCIDEIYIFGVPITSNHEPSQAPTVKPGINPIKNSSTVAPTASPSIFNTEFPTLLPTLYPTKTLKGTSTVDASNNANGENMISKARVRHKTIEFTVSIGIACIFIAVFFIGIIDAKCIHKNDRFRAKRVILPFFYLYDQVSDIFAGINMYSDYTTSHRQIFLILFSCSLAFVVLPSMISNIQLMFAVKKQFIGDSHNGSLIRAWLLDYSKVMYILSLLIGSCFGAISLLNSNLLGLELFDMGIPEMIYINFINKGIYNIIIFENIPQIFIQLMYIKLSSRVSLINYVSITWSGVSIIATVLSYVTHKTIFVNDDFIVLSFDVIHDDINYKIARCNSKNIIKKISTVLRTPFQSIYESKPLLINGGLNIKFNINTSTYIENHNKNIRINDIVDINKKLEEYKKLLNNNSNVRLITDAICESWTISVLNTNIKNICVEFKPSKRRYKNTVDIKLRRLTLSLRLSNRFSGKAKKNGKKQNESKHKNPCELKDRIHEIKSDNNADTIVYVDQENPSAEEPKLPKISEIEKVPSNSLYLIDNIIPDVNTTPCDFYYDNNDLDTRGNGEYSINTNATTHFDSIHAEGPTIGNTVL